MNRILGKSNLLVVVFVWLGLLGGAHAAEMFVIRDGRLLKDSLDWPDMGPGTEAFWKDWIHCGGKTVNGLYVAPKRFANKLNHSRFRGNKSALGDCEFRVVFSCTEHLNRFPNITITDRAVLRFSGDGRQVWLSIGKMSLPLKAFAANCKRHPFDGKLHSLAVRRTDKTISFYQTSV